MSDYNPSPSDLEQEAAYFQGFYADDELEERAIVDTDAAQHHALVSTRPNIAPVICPTCTRPYTDWNECEYIGWNGQCIDCDVKKWEAESSRTVGGLFEFEDFGL